MASNGCSRSKTKSEIFKASRRRQYCWEEGLRGKTLNLGVTIRSFRSFLYTETLKKM